MEIKIEVEQSFNAKTLNVSAGVRYWEDADINGKEDINGEIPCREDEYWCPIIEVDSGKILNWTKGVTASIHYKVCDDGNYKLFDKDKKMIFEYSGYVPDILCPNENGYGDYIIMEISEQGIIKDWDSSKIESFLNEQDLG